MSITFPNTAYELLVVFVPYVMILLGCGYLIFPRQLLYYSGLRPRADAPEALGEARASFAGPLIAVGLGSLLLQEPIALQPGLSISIAFVWSIAVIGRFVQIFFDAGWRKRLIFRLAVSAFLAALAWYVSEVPSFVCLEPMSIYCTFPQTIRGQAILLVAIVTLLIGLFGFLFPKRTLHLLGMEPRSRALFAFGETRGLIAGLYIVIGGIVVLSPQPVEFVALVLSGTWVIVGLFRLFSCLIDRGKWIRGAIRGVLELIAGVWLTGLILGLI